MVDFFHVCDYLNAAALGIHSEASVQKQWLQVQKERLKFQGLGRLLNELQANQEPPGTADELAPVRRCYRYLSQRQGQLDCEGAIRNDLPIGSGEIESAHRYLVQKRLKLPGSWWKPENAKHMLSLRVSRHNGEWQSYWATNYLHVAVASRTSL